MIMAMILVIIISIYKPYGTMEDFQLLLQEAHKRDIKLIMDIVVNHTSTEHPWFKQARASKDNRYRDFFIFGRTRVQMGQPLIIGDLNLVDQLGNLTS